ncbi:hypothetical protein TUZN_0461 [Thermoproteus uzoniensis 768-20]|uniref:Uncharacterized protein n=1 Tax=Thermoproteus uzoniensis (strain 768-20) TaxID=999630 RepID=F2L398_THEU7|nr:hypothetical protein [Thermoproteus uzoniensis]AEA11957.1 hypothetical protein TUZN_0461 [Thermoproteus uzoniensis 768-20]
MRLLWIGIVLLALLAIPHIGLVVYAVGPAPGFQVGRSYISVGYDKYYLFSVPYLVSWVISAIAIATAGYYEVRKGVRPRGSAVSVAVLSIVFASPLPLIFSEQNGLTVIAVSNAFSSAGPIMFLVAVALELAEHYLLPHRVTKILAMPEVAVEKTEKV